MPYYPIFLDIKNRRCLVVGGGAVAFRKVNMLLDHEANVEVISPQLCPELDEMVNRNQIRLKLREFEEGDLEGSFVVVAATDNPETNERIAREATQRGILLNVVDVPRLSNFIVPSYLRRGDLTLAISTNGKSPALARKIRLELESKFDEDYAFLISLVDEVRRELKGESITVSPDSWQKALDIEKLLEMLRSGNRSEARITLMNELRGMRSEW